MANLKSICVYCGSKTGTNPEYQAAAVALADYLLANDMQLVNGGGSIGLMGVMADHILAHGGKCTGVIPLSLKSKEVAHTGMTELIVVPDMHSRKLTMVNVSDAFIAIPGGFGTLDELFETLTWGQLNLHNKPVGLLNVNGYFDNLLALADHMTAEGFVKKDARALIRVADNVEDLFAELTRILPKTSAKWS